MVSRGLKWKAGVKAELSWNAYGVNPVPIFSILGLLKTKSYFMGIRLQKKKYIVSIYLEDNRQL